MGVFVDKNESLAMETKFMIMEYIEIVYELVFMIIQFLAKPVASLLFVTFHIIYIPGYIRTFVTIFQG